MTSVTATDAMSDVLTGQERVPSEDPGYAYKQEVFNMILGLYKLLRNQLAWENA